jgi:4-amino-4-deoxy-L-arabinose transferase-like glycosyltransferase
LSALLGFAAFTLLLGERPVRPRGLIVFGAGVIAGLAVTVEYPLIIVVGLVGLHALARRPRLRRRAPIRSVLL